MKRIVISRKGFDSSTGKKPSRGSPIFDDGTIFSIPVHIDNQSPHVFKEVKYGGINAYEAIKYVYSNSRKKVYSENDVCHFDPNLSLKPGLLGQQGTGQGELEKGGVDKGDLFLFFGWFKTYRLTKHKKNLDCHHLFGWLQIGKIVQGTKNIKDFCEEKGIKHPHSYGLWTKNTLYVATSHLNSRFGVLQNKGSGYFPKTNEKLVLSEMENKRKSIWKMPAKYFSEIGKSLHADNMFFVSNSSGPCKWLKPKQLSINTNVGNWQEMVLNSADYPNLERWAYDLIKEFG